MCVCGVIGVSRQIAEIKDSYEEKLENTFEMYKDALKEHAYQCAMERLEEDYIPIEEYNTAQDREQVTQIHIGPGVQAYWSMQTHCELILLRS